MIADIIILLVFMIIFVIIIVEKICKEYKDSLNKILYNLQKQIDDIWKYIKKKGD